METEHLKLPWITQLVHIFMVYTRADIIEVDNNQTDLDLLKELRLLKGIINERSLQWADMPTATFL